ncbi:MAG: GNAT family N-acetyltransferase [Verrucomicrobiota bacterium JB022]|nr:GNAT family N-acetyltransferase [Verrucomicrobiota bacterium JB022]
MRYVTDHPDLVLRAAQPADAETLLELIRGLAIYEHLEHEVEATPEQLRATLFGERRYAEAVIAEWQGQPAGFSLYFHTYSTFLGRPGIYIEDIFVLPTLRGHGIGSALLRFVAAVAVERQCGRLEWAVLDWNEPALAFYRANGAMPLEEWTTQRVTGQALLDLAARSHARPDAP